MEVEVFEGGFDRNLSYLIYDKKTRKAFVIDPFYKIEIYTKKADEIKICVPERQRRVAALLA